MNDAVAIENVSIVFGPRPQRALAAMDRGASREEVQAETGQTFGVHDANLAVREGETLVLMGLSGSGKSTLLRAVNGLAPVVRGRVRLAVGGALEDVTGAAPRRLRRLRGRHVAMVFQQFALMPWRSVAENVSLGLELAGIGRAERARRVAAQLALVGLSDWADRRVEELSGGMQQRVGLARAFATDAPVLLMDEPFSALDPLIRARLQDELRDLQARLRKTILFVSHDLEEAFRLGDRIAIMEGGRIVQTGTPREIMAAPATPYVADFLAGLNPLAVLRARDALAPGPAIHGEAGRHVDAETPLRDVLGDLAASAPLVVMEGGQALGHLTHDSLVSTLAARAVPEASIGNDTP